MKTGIKNKLIILTCVLIAMTSGCQKKEVQPDEPDILEVKDLATEH